MPAVKELLLETLDDLSYGELEKFKWLLQFTFFQKDLPHIWRQLQVGNSAELLVDLMVEMYGQQSVEVTREVFVYMNRTDLVQILSETSSGAKEKHSVDEHWPELIQKEEMMVSVIELLLVTLAELSDGELKSFKRVLLSQIHIPTDIPLRLLETTDRQHTVFLMVQIYGRQSVETTKEVLKEIERTDLVQRLSDSSSGPKEKPSADGHCSALIQKVATIAAVKQLLLETLNDLSYEMLEEFREFLQMIVYQKNLPDISWMVSYTADTEETVDLMVQTYGQQSVELTMEVFMDMNRPELMQRLSKSSSGLKEKQSVDERRPALSERTAAMAAVKQVLLETLEDLSNEMLKKFKWLLHFTCFQKSLQHLSWSQLQMAEQTYILVDLMVQTYGQQSVEVTMEVFMDMNRTDLVQKLSETSSTKEKHQSKSFQKEVTETSKQKLLETIKDLSYEEFEQFKWFLQHPVMKKGFPRIQRRRLEMANRAEMVELMVEIYGQQSVELTMEVLSEMNRSDLVQRLSERGPSRSLELEGCGSIMDSSDWTKLEPEVNSTDADEAPTYSLQSEAGRFECSVSDLRWVCKEQVSFKYRLCSWEDHMERMESIEYMPAGPLIDITVIAGKLFEVYLPHWICIDDNPKILDKFAVLHIDDCGDVVEKVTEVTPSHVKLSEPIFSPRAALMKVGFPVKIYCNVLIYKINIAFLTLHVYLIPCDPGLQQIIDKMELSDGYKIRKPHPEKSLKIRDKFILTADLDDADISPKKLKLRHNGKNQNFCEVFIENPDIDFTLQLTQENELQPVWTCTIRKDEYHSTGHMQEKHSVDELLSVLMQKATITKDRERLLKTLEHLKQEELKEFKWFLRDRDIGEGLPCIPRKRLDESDMLDLVDLMMQTYSQQCVEVTKKVFKKIQRNDLVQMLSD